MRVALYGASGKVGALLAPALASAGHDTIDGRTDGPAGCDAAIDFTTPDAVGANVAACLDARVPVVIGTTGFDLDATDAAAREAGVPCFHAPNFAQGAVLMMRFAEEAARVFPQGGDRRAPFGCQARRAVGDLAGDGGADGDEPPDPLDQTPGPRGASGGRLRRPGGDAHDPARHDLA